LVRSSMTSPPILLMWNTTGRHLVKRVYSRIRMHRSIWKGLPTMPALCRHSHHARRRDAAFRIVDIRKDQQNRALSEYKFKNFPLHVRLPA
ncbi:MAG: hypothetical protein AB8B94_07035, partial [Hyphomicrobiales bacterium]